MPTVCQGLQSIKYCKLCHVSWKTSNENETYYAVFSEQIGYCLSYAFANETACFEMIAETTTFNAFVWNNLQVGISF